MDYRILIKLISIKTSRQYLSIDIKYVHILAKYICETIHLLLHLHYL
jgi:hypothetical protein